MKRRVAHSVRIGICSDPTCRCVHLEMVDIRGRVFGEAALPTDDESWVENFMNRVEKARQPKVAAK